MRKGTQGQAPWRGLENCHGAGGGRGRREERGNSETGSKHLVVGSKPFTLAGFFNTQESGVRKKHHGITEAQSRKGPNSIFQLGKQRREVRWVGSLLLLRVQGPGFQVWASGLRPSNSVCISTVKFSHTTSPWA